MYLHHTRRNERTFLPIAPDVNATYEIQYNRLCIYPSESPSFATNEIVMNERRGAFMLISTISGSSYLVADKNVWTTVRVMTTNVQGIPCFTPINMRFGENGEILLHIVGRDINVGIVDKVSVQNWVIDLCSGNCRLGICPN